MSSQEIIKIFEKNRFQDFSSKRLTCHHDEQKGNTGSDPVHPRKDVKPGLIRAIIKEAGLKREDFFKLLKKT